jgi:hypothetical protein
MRPRSRQILSLARPARAFLAFAAFTLAGCGTAFISPVLADDEVTFDPLLLGSWESRSEDSTESTRLIITRDSTLSYAWDSTRTDGIAIAGMTVHRYIVDLIDEDGDRERYEARLGRFAGLRVLEVRPVVPEVVEGSYNESLMLRLYSMVVIDRVSAEVLDVRPLAPEALGRTVRRTPSPTPWVETDRDRLVLTGDTETLRGFLRAFLRQPDALEASTRFVRMRAP